MARKLCTSLFTGQQAHLRTFLKGKMERWLQFKCKIVRAKDNAESLSAFLFVKTVDCSITLQKGAKLNTPVSGVNTFQKQEGSLRI